MEKNRPSRKLRLNRETVQVLEASQAAMAQGGVYCPTHTCGCSALCTNGCSAACTNNNCAPSANPGDTQCQCM